MSPRGALLSLRVGVIAGSLLLVSVGCAVKPGSQAGGANPILGSGITDEIDALAMLDPEIHAKVDDCVDSAKLKAYGGDPVWQRTWIDVGESDVGLREFCENLASRDPAAFAQIHTEWIAWEALVAAGSGVPAPAPIPETVPTNPPPCSGDSGDSGDGIACEPM